LLGLAINLLETFDDERLEVLHLDSLARIKY
jgi:hypothetical protein